MDPFTPFPFPFTRLQCPHAQFYTEPYALLGQAMPSLGRLRLRLRAGNARRAPRENPVEGAP